MKLFRENPPKAVFWYGFGLVCIILFVGMGYFAYIVSNEKPAIVEKKVTSGPTAEEVQAGKINATTAGKIVSVSEKSLVLSVNGQNLTFTVNQATTYSKGVSQVEGDSKDLKPGMSIALGYNKDTNAAYNVSY